MIFLDVLSEEKQKPPKLYQQVERNKLLIVATQRTIQINNWLNSTPTCSVAMLVL